MWQFLSILAEDPFLGEVILIPEAKRHVVHVRVRSRGEIRGGYEVKGQHLGVAFGHGGTYTRLVAERTVVGQYELALVGVIHRRHRRLLGHRQRFHETRAATGPLVRRGHRLPFGVLASPFANERGQWAEVGRCRVIDLRPLERHGDGEQDDGKGDTSFHERPR